MKLNLRKNKFLKRLILVILLLGCVGFYVANRFVKRYGFSNLGEFITVYSHNKELADKVEPKELALILSESDYAFLEKRRNDALERGIQINDGEDNYVKCKIVEDGDTVKGEMRLKGHMTDHLEGDKWSFRVKTRKKPIMGMTRFSLQAPGTRNYAYEWVYHQLLKNEDVIYLKYDFIHLTLNDKDLGIYAVEEHFGQHVLDRNKRPNGAILRWNPNLYWEWRIDELQGTYLDEQYASYESSFVEPYEKGTVEKDSILKETYKRGAQLLEDFRRGVKPASDVFDVERMARFHAIIDLVGGYHSLDWSDVKFFYNAETNRIEPVGYESFSVRKTEKIAGQRIPSDYETPQFNYHDQLFADSIFFEAYIAALERICDEKYLNAFIQKIQPELDEKLGVLAHEFPYRKFSFDPYFENIDLIRHNLELPKPFHAFLEKETDTTVEISVTPVSDFPIEIVSLLVDNDEEYFLRVPFYLPAKARNTYAHYFNLQVNHRAKKLKNLKLRARIPGSSKWFQVDVSELPSYRETPEPRLDLSLVNVKENSLAWFNDSICYLKNRETNLSGCLIINPGVTLKVFPGQVLNFSHDAQIVVYGKLEMLGGVEDEQRIVVSAQGAIERDLDAQRLYRHLILINGQLICQNVDFFKAEDFLYAKNSTLRFLTCAFAESKTDYMHCCESGIWFEQCSIGAVSSMGEFDRSLVRMHNVTAKNGTIFFKAKGADVDLVNTNILRYDTIASLDYNASCWVWDSDFSANDLIASLNHASEFRTFGSVVRDAEFGFSMDQNTLLPGNSHYELYRSNGSGLKKMEQRP